MSMRSSHNSVIIVKPRMHGPASIAFRSAMKARQQRSTRFEPRTFNVEANTVEGVFAMETPVDRYHGTEILECSDAAIDMARLIGAAVLDSHNQRSTQSLSLIHI